MIRPEIEPQSPGPLANTLLTWPIYIYMYGRCAKKYIGGQVYMMISYVLLTFLPMGCKHRNTYWRNVKTAWETLLKNKPNWVTFHESILVSLWTFLPVLELTWGCPRGVMVKAMDCGIVVSEFVLQSRYYVHFRANTLGKGTNPLILPAMG